MDSPNAFLRDVEAAARQQADRLVKLLATLFAACASTCALNSCSPAPEAFLTVEVCLKDSAGAIAFERELRAIARSQGLRIIDTSEETERGLDRIGSSQLQNSLGRPVMNLMLKHADSIVMTIGNIGLPSGQAVLAFFDETDSFDSRGFAETFVSRLEQEWGIEVVTAGAGAQGMKSCNRPS